MIFLPTTPDDGCGATLADCFFESESDDFRSSRNRSAGSHGDRGEFFEHLILKIVTDEFQFPHLTDDDLHLVIIKMLQYLRRAFRS